MSNHRAISCVRSAAITKGSTANSRYSYSIRRRYRDDRQPAQTEEVGIPIFMKFCSACDKPLEFLEFLDGELCSECRAKNTAPPQQPGEAAIDFTELLQCELILGGDKAQIRSPEGWVLWSGTAQEQGYPLTDLLNGAWRIMQIRRKRRTGTN